MRISRIITVCSIALILAGCACFNTVNSTSNRTTTVGQELIDLQKAKESGVIDEKEYKQAKEKLLKMAETNTVKFESETSYTKKQ